MSGPNQYAVNPLPPPGQRSSWIQRHGKTVVYGAAVVGVVGVVGAAAWAVGSALLGQNQPPACQALQNQLTQLDAQLFAIYKQAAGQNGTFTASQQAEVQSLQQEIASVISQMGNVCVASPGATLEKAIDQIIVYAGWAAAILVGIATVYAIAWFVKRWGGSGKNPGRAPSSPSDVEVSTEFDQATMGSDAAMAQSITRYETGQADAAETSATTQNLALNDPAIPVSQDVSALFRNAAESASEVFAVVLDALATLWDAIVTALSDLAFEITLYLGL